MSRELTNLQMCILMRNGMQIWIDKEKALKLQDILQGIDNNKFIRYENITINTADITGIFTPLDLDDFIKIKRGNWKCKRGNWHTKEQDCDCPEDIKTFIIDGKEFTKDNFNLAVRNKEVDYDSKNDKWFVCK